MYLNISLLTHSKIFSNNHYKFIYVWYSNLKKLYIQKKISQAAIFLLFLQHIKFHQILTPSSSISGCCLTFPSTKRFIKSGGGVISDIIVIMPRTTTAELLLALKWIHCLNTIKPHRSVSINILYSENIFQGGTWTLKTSHNMSDEVINQISSKCVNWKRGPWNLPTFTIKIQIKIYSSRKYSTSLQYLPTFPGSH